MRIFLFLVAFCLLFFFVYKFLKRNWNFWKEELSDCKKLQDERDEIDIKMKRFADNLKAEERDLKNDLNTINKLKKESNI